MNKNAFVKTLFRPDFLKPLIISFALIALYRLGVLIPIPFIDPDAIQEFTISPGAQFSILMLGIMPYASAYLLVEIFSLIIPYLKKLRRGDLNGRRKLKRIALYLSLPYSVIHANSIISGLKNFNVPAGARLLKVENGMEHVLLVLILVASFYALVGLCELISRTGFCNGISLLILGGACAQFIAGYPFYIRFFKEDGLFVFLFAAVVFFALVGFASILLRTRVSVKCMHPKLNSPVGYFQLPLCPSSKEALIYSGIITAVPATFFLQLGIGNIAADWTQPGSISYSLITIFFILLLSYLFAWAFLHPKRRLKKLKARGWQILEDGSKAEQVLLTKLMVYNLPWAAYLSLMAVLPHMLITGANVPFYIGGASIPVLVAVCLDIIGRFRFAIEGGVHPFKIAEFHDVYDAIMIRNHLNSEGITNFLQGYHHRLLLYIFGPYIDISLWVAKKDKKRAETLIREFHGGLGMVL